ncbi:Organic cation transporter 1 [Nymphon striatum]|nr:Organic cation transporter 1 [Nymphon striatum]
MKMENFENDKPQSELEKATNGIKRWQLYVLIGNVLVSFILCPANFAMPFYAPKIDHWCAKPDNFRDVSISLWKNLSLPHSHNSASQCKMYDLNYQNVTSKSYVPFMHSHSNETLQVIKCGKWDYDHSVWKRTIIDSFNVVCDQSYLASISSSMYLVGMMIGLPIFGQISDKFGRKKAILIGMTLWTLVSLSIAFSNSIVMFTVLRLLLGATDLGGATATYVMFQESLSNKNRSRIGTIDTLMFSIATACLSGICYLLKDWKHIQLVVTAPIPIGIAIFYFLPESPRWLVSVENYEGALSALKTISKINKEPLSRSDDEILQELKSININADSTNVFREKTKQYNFLDLFKTPKMRRNTLSFYYIWAVVSLLFYALTLNMKSLGGNLFLDMTIAGGLDTIGYFVTVLLLVKIGRKYPTMCALFLAGTCFLVSIPIPTSKVPSAHEWDYKNYIETRPIKKMYLTLTMILKSNLEWLKTGISLVGRACISVSFSIVYLYTAEVHPTVVRNIGVSTSSTCARLSSTLAPFSKELTKMTNPNVTKGIFGALAITAGLVTLLLPETRNKILPETVEDVERPENLIHKSSSSEKYRAAILASYVTVVTSLLQSRDVATAESFTKMALAYIDLPSDENVFIIIQVDSIRPGGG